ncbi:discoidin domain-containing protein [Petropleomorpha daqingensis]|uniref:NAD glycohydrolase translocation F5/8 type C domain-containing protein n=1 Tax=Petropleomorpha daqingensis TaxID=2026353 RepID=A0A853CA27_9ACTN|nr:discoidin domain-containing protein [Petropleomorpha daqingensis]NYJ03856.1 hypothetical protein [Petropleomorpha daqingensis]
MDETELRLQELLDLYSRGALSEQDYVQARAQVLAGARTDVHPVDPRPPTQPVGYGPPPAPRPGPGHRTRSVVIVASAAVLLVALVAGGLLWLRSQGTSGSPQEAARTAAAGKKLEEGTPTSARGPETALHPDTALAQCVSQPSQDAAGHPTSYEPALVLDGRPDTAWRCDGDGVGQTLEIRFGQAHDVDRVGLIPGFAKTDPADATDRYAQDRRIAAVQYTFDDGSTAVQRFDTDPADRSLQSMQVPRVHTARIDITILQSVPGATVNGQPAVDKVAVSEVAFSGPAG